jgi:hypothetical protein
VITHAQVRRCSGGEEEEEEEVGREMRRPKMGVVAVESRKTQLIILGIPMARRGGGNE